MKPKNKKDIIEETCKRTGDSNACVEDVVSFYWKRGVYEKIREIPHFSIAIPNLGTFELIRKNIPTLIEFFKRKDDQPYLERMLNVQRILLGEYERMNEKRELKKKYYENLEKLEKDS